MGLNFFEDLLIKRGNQIVSHFLEFPIPITSVIVINFPVKLTVLMAFTTTPTFCAPFKFRGTPLKNLCLVHHYHAQEIVFMSTRKIMM